MSLLPKAGLLRVGQLDFKLEAAGGSTVTLAIPQQSGSAFAVVSILYALKLGWRHIFWWEMEKLGAACLLRRQN